jgi:hypothetical protein
VDRDSGAGIIDAFAALQVSGATSFSNLELGTVTPPNRVATLTAL